VTNLHNERGVAMAVRALRVGYAAGRFPAAAVAQATVTTDASGIEARGGGSGLERLHWTMRGDGSLQLDYVYALDGDVAYHGLTFDLPETQMEKLTWLGEGPYRVWQNRLRGTTLGVHSTARNDIQPGETWGYPEFQGYFAGLRWARLDTTAGPVTVTSASPAIFLRVGTPRITHPTTTIDFPAGDLSFLHAIPAIGSKSKPAEQAGPQSQWAKASGHYEGSLVFRFTP
jgi:hypothetical protein